MELKDLSSGSEMTTHVTLVKYSFSWLLLLLIVKELSAHFTESHFGN